MANIDQMLIEYYESDDFRQDLLLWVSAPAKSAGLRQHIVSQMNANRAALGRRLTDDNHRYQDKFVSGEMSYDELMLFVQEYVLTIRVTQRNHQP